MTHLAFSAAVEDAALSAALLEGPPFALPLVTPLDGVLKSKDKKRFAERRLNSGQWKRSKILLSVKIEKRPRSEEKGLLRVSKSLYSKRRAHAGRRHPKSSTIQGL